MKNLSLLALLFLPLFLLSQKTPLREAAPESAGMSATKLRYLDTLMLGYIAEKRVPGMTAIVCRNGKIVYHKAFGARDTDPLQRDDIYRIASMTKAVTSVAALMLLEEGKYALDDPLSKYLPEFKSPRVLVSYNAATGESVTEPARSEISIRQLFTHTSGIAYGELTSPDFKNLFDKAEIRPLPTAENLTLRENIRRLAAMPLGCHPGEKWLYGMNTDVLGHLVEVLSGQSLDAFFRTRIFEPLGMHDTYFFLPEGKKERLVPIYTESGAPATLQKWTASAPYDTEFPVRGAKKLFLGGSGLSSTALDYAIFLQMLLDGGAYNGQRILSRKTVEMLLANQIGDLKPFNPDEKFSLCFALPDPAQPGRNPGAPGKLSWGGYFSTHYFADTKEQLSVVVMKQMQGDNRAWDIMPRLEAVVYGAFLD
jgi:CubicO group peptidase (beta-lactamase class C family)